MKDIRELINKLTDNSKPYKQLALPSFQREFVWSVESQKSLIASVLTGVPCTSSLIVESDSSLVEFKCREIGKNSKQRSISIPPSVSMNYLLDGQQRFSTLYYAFYHVYSFEKNKFHNNKIELESLYGELCYRWFIKFDETNSFFGFADLVYDEVSFNRYLPDHLLDVNLIQAKKLTSKGKEGYSINATWDELNSWCVENSCLPLFLFFDSANSHRLWDLLQRIQEVRLKRLLDNSEFDLLKEIVIREMSIDDFDKNCKYLSDPLASKKKKSDALNAIQKAIANQVAIWSKQIANFLETRVKNYNLNPIVLDDVNKAVSTYTFINTGGTKLSVFDLICAKSSGDLRNDIQVGVMSKFQFFNNLFQHENVEFDSESKFAMFNEESGWDTSFSNFIIHLYNLVYFKEQNVDIDSLPSNFSKVDFSLSKLKGTFIDNKKGQVIEIAQKVCYFVHCHCGHRKFSDISNKLLLLPIACGFIWNDKHDSELLKKLRSFFWIKLFSGEYDSHQNEKSWNDCKDVVKWLIKGDMLVEDGLKQLLQDRVLNKDEFSDKKSTTEPLRMPNRSLLNNLLFYLRSINEEFHDFDSNNSLFEMGQKHEAHHLVPLSDASSIGEGTKKIRRKLHPLNVVMNFSPISPAANLEIGRFNLTQYSKRLKTVTKDDHHLTNKWFNFSFDANDPAIVGKYKEMIEERHDAIAKDMRFKLKI
jgi:hypothetical protein